MVWMRGGCDAAAPGQAPRRADPGAPLREAGRLIRMRAAVTMRALIAAARGAVHIGAGRGAPACAMTMAHGGLALNFYLSVN